MRPREWARVTAFATEVAPRPAALVVEGEAGSGKSRLWRAGVAAAEAAGHRVLSCEPCEAEAPLPFAALLDLLDGLLPEVADAIPEPQREALEVALVLRAAGPEPPTPHAIGLAVLSALRAAATAVPVLVAVDDAHWLDRASQDALVFALRRLRSDRVSLLITARTEAPADPRTVAEPPPSTAWRALPAGAGAGDDDALRLAPLDDGSVRRLLAATLEAPVSRADAGWIAEQSRGNPFWAVQLGTAMGRGGEPRLPPAARSLGRRLADALPAGPLAALAVVSAAGRCTAADAIAVLGGSVSDPAAALDEAVTAGVLVETGGRLAPAHPLIGKATVDALPPVRRSALYASLAERAEGPERRAHFAVLATEPGPDPATAILLDAAAGAAQARAAGVAAALFARAATRFTPESDVDGLTERRIRAAELLFVVGELEESLAQLGPVDHHRLPVADQERVLPLLADLLSYLRGTDEARRLVTDAVASAGTDPRRRALALALASDADYGEPGGTRAAAEEAIRCADLTGTVTATLHRALGNLVEVKLDAGAGLDHGLLDRARQIEADLRLTGLNESADALLGYWSKSVDDLDASRAALRRCLARAQETGQEMAAGLFHVHLAATEGLAGDYRACAEHLDVAAELTPWTTPPLSVLSARADLLIAAGDPDAAVALVDEHLPDDDRTPVRRRLVGGYVRGLVELGRGRPAEAVRHLEVALACAEPRGVHEPGARRRLDIPLARAYSDAGRPEEAARIAARLGELGDRLDRPTLRGDAARITAELAAARGDLDTAVAAAREAVAEHRRSQLRPELVASLLTLGRVERRRRARSQAREALDEALALATGMGHRALADEVAGERDRVAAARSGSALTATERRVAELIASGATNRAAAAALFVGVRTVETHVAAVYRKLGVRTRAELGRRISAGGLDGDLPDDGTGAGGAGAGSG